MSTGHTMVNCCSTCNFFALSIECQLRSCRTRTRCACFAFDLKFNESRTSVKECRYEFFFRHLHSTFQGLLAMRQFIYGYFFVLLSSIFILFSFCSQFDCANEKSKLLFCVPVWRFWPHLSSLSLSRFSYISIAVFHFEIFHDWFQRAECTVIRCLGNLSDTAFRLNKNKEQLKTSIAKKPDPPDGAGIHFFLIWFHYFFFPHPPKRHWN